MNRIKSILVLMALVLSGAQQASAVPTEGIRASSFSASYAHACAVVNGGQVVCWGKRLCHEPVGHHALPFRVPGTERYRFVKVTVGSEHACGLTHTGDVYCWGYNASGQVIPTAPQGACVSTPTRIDFSRVVSDRAARPVDIAATNFGTLARFNDRVMSVVHWGYIAPQSNTMTRMNLVTQTGAAIMGPAAGLVGNASTLEWSYYSPKNGLVAMPGLGRLGQSLVALSDEGESIVFDRRINVLLRGRFVPGTVSHQLVALGIPQYPVLGVAAARGTFCTVERVPTPMRGQTFNMAHCWGRNSSGQVGNGTLSSGVSYADSLTRPYIMFPGNVVALQGARDNVCALNDSGEIYCTGDQSMRGDGLNANTVSHPTRVLLEAAFR